MAVGLLILALIFALIFGVVLAALSDHPTPSQTVLLPVGLFSLVAAPLCLVLAAIAWLLGAIF